MPVKSLVELVTAVCIRNAKQLESVGDFLPFRAVECILQRVESAHQLRQIELNSPQIQGETDALWLKIIEKDFPLEFRSQSYKPKDSKKWFKVWEKYKKLRDRSIAEGERQLKEAFTGIKEDRQKNTSKIVDRNLLPNGGLPRRRPRAGFHSAVTRTASSGRKGILHRARREAQEIARMHGSLNRMTTPSLRGASVSKAPSAMLDDYRRAAQPHVSLPPLQPERATAVPECDQPERDIPEREKCAEFLSDSEDDEGACTGEGSSSRAQGGALPTVATKKRTTGPAAQTVSRNFAKALLKPSEPPLLQKKPEPSRPPSSPTARAQPTSKLTAPASQRAAANRTEGSLQKKGSGILSNRYKPPGQRPNAIQVPASVAPKQEPSTVLSEDASIQQRKPTQLPSRDQVSPPGTAVLSSPPPPETLSGPCEPQARKRKTVDLFVRPRKKPR